MYIKNFACYLMMILVDVGEAYSQEIKILSNLIKDENENVSLIKIILYSFFN